MEVISKCSIWLNIGVLKLPQWSNSMKHIHIPCIHSSLPVLFWLFQALFLVNISFTSAAGPDHYSEETLISIDYEKTELGQVLKQISWITGYSFVINKEYAKLKVSGSLRDVPLHQSLKEIIGERSHTIIYEPNKTISLILYKSSPPAPYIQGVTEIYPPDSYTIIPPGIADELRAETRDIDFNAEEEETFQDFQLNENPEDFTGEEIDSETHQDVETGEETVEPLNPEETESASEYTEDTYDDSERSDEFQDHDELE